MYLQPDIKAFWKNKKVMVTGAGGFLGSHLCQQLAEVGAWVTGVDRSSSKQGGSPASDMPSISILNLKVQDTELSSFVSQNAFDAIFHLAGLADAAQSVTDPLLDFELNLQATVQFLEILRQNSFHGSLIYTSSAAVYGQPQKFPITEDSVPLPISPYGVSKLATEHYIRVYSNLYNFRTATARLFSLYGPRQRKQVVFDIMKKTFQSDEEIELLGDGDEIRDFMYVEDAATALLYLGRLPFADETIFNVCSGQGTSIRTLAEAILKFIGADSKRLHFTGRKRLGDPREWVGCNKLLTCTGFQSRFDLEHGLNLTIDWCRKGL